MAAKSARKSPKAAKRAASAPPRKAPARKATPRKTTTKSPAKPKVARKASTSASSTVPATLPQPVLEWQPVPDSVPVVPLTPQTVPAVQAPVARPPRPAQPFDPATGDWLPVDEAAPAGPAAASPLAPDAPRKSTAAVVWTVILGIDLALLALNFLGALAIGIILIFFPDSARAEELRGAFEGGSRSALVLETLLTFLMMGVIPFAWVLGTRRVPWEGAKRYLHLHGPVKGVLQGIALTPVLLLAVIALSSVYVLLTEGPDGFSLTESEGENPAVEAILAQLTWPIAVLIALCAGVGEEILFRGVLQRRLGIWGQATLFGLAHAAGGYLPQILFAFGLGVFFGFLLRRGWSLVALMTAHFLYDIVLLSIGLVYG